MLSSNTVLIGCMLLYSRTSFVQGSEVGHNLEGCTVNGTQVEGLVGDSCFMAHIHGRKVIHPSLFVPIDAVIISLFFADSFVHVDFFVAMQGACTFYVHMQHIKLKHNAHVPTTPASLKGKSSRAQSQNHAPGIQNVEAFDEY